MLDLEKLAAPRAVTVPVLNGHFVFEKRHFSIQSENGWQKVEINNKRVRLIEPGILSDVYSNLVLGYTHGNSIIFQNFDSAKRRFKLGMGAPLHFNQSETFSAIRAVVWEDGLIYWAEPNYTDTKIFEIKEAFEQEKSLTQEKGITPELRTLYLHHALERDNLRALLQAEQDKEDHDRMMRDIPYRLKITFERAGAEMVNFSISGHRIVVDWRSPGSHNVFNSVIDSRTWMVIEAGYCMSGDDKRHNITSMVKTSELYQEARRVVVTRFTGDDALVRGPHLEREAGDENDWDD